MPRFGMANNKEKSEEKAIIAEETPSPGPQQTPGAGPSGQRNTSTSLSAAPNTAIPSCFLDTNGVITVTTNDVPGHRVTAVLGTIYGITVRSRNWGADVGAFLKSAVGGEIKYFTNLMYTSREAALERLVGECMARGGNAVLALRFDMCEVS